LTWSAKNFWHQCHLADERKRKNQTPRFRPWPAPPPENIPHNWDEMTLDQLYGLFLRQHQQRLAAKKK
jgi:hypothetical protein